jgi:hypothetical protein
MIFLSKFLPLFIYPTGLMTLLVILTLVFWKKRRLALSFLVTAFAILLIGGQQVRGCQPGAHARMAIFAPAHWHHGGCNRGARRRDRTRGHAPAHG